MCPEKGSEYLGIDVCETIHYLSLSLYTNSLSEVFRTLFEAHIVCFVKLYISALVRFESVLDSSLKNIKIGKTKN